MNSKEENEIEEYICGTAHSFFRVQPNRILHVIQQISTYYSLNMKQEMVYS